MTPTRGKAFVAAGAGWYISSGGVRACPPMRRRGASDQTQAHPARHHPGPVGVGALAIGRGEGRRGQARRPPQGQRGRQGPPPVSPARRAGAVPARHDAEQRRQTPRRPHPRGREIRGTFPRHLRRVRGRARRARVAGAAAGGRAGPRHHQRQRGGRVAGRAEGVVRAARPVPQPPPAVRQARRARQPAVVGRLQVPGHHARQGAPVGITTPVPTVRGGPGRHRASEPGPDSAE